AGFILFWMAFGFLASVFGVVQHLILNGNLYWFRDMEYGGIPFGPYVNRNHFAGFVELILPLSLVPLVLGRVRRERRPVVGLFAIIPIVALFLSVSRGGFVSFGVELAVLALVMIQRRTKGQQLFACGSVLLLALLMVSWLGVSQVLERFSSFRSLEVIAVKRASMRRDPWQLFHHHPS